MPYEDFVKIWDKLMESPHIDKVFVNNTGDMYNHPDRIKIFDYMEKTKCKWVVMTTNAAKMDYVPKIDELIISFNGGDPEGYEYTTGLDFKSTYMRIRGFYEEYRKLRNLELHCLIWDGNKEGEKNVGKLWMDFPGRVRISYKYDNQQKEDHTIDKYKRNNRIECDYLDKLSIWSNGDIIMCAHDFEGKNVFGNILNESIDNLLENSDRMKKRLEHMTGVYKGLCEKCNYNTTTWGKIHYIKG
jgi:radical SAM protein with 4Fe4S-binding SPASM domain